MKKEDKKIFIYALLMSGAVLLIILISCLSDMKFDSMENNYKKIITEQTNEAESYAKNLQLLQEENVKLKNELDELKNKSSKITSDGETYSQAMKILSDIYLLIESGDKEKAKEELEKFDTSTFDDTIINYKKALIELVK